MSPVVHGLPHATTACVPVLNWRTDNAPAERAAVSIAVSNIFLAMCVLLSGKKLKFVFAINCARLLPGPIVPPNQPTRTYFNLSRAAAGPFWNAALSGTVKLHLHVLR
jgi:hypothetical protein